MMNSLQQPESILDKAVIGPSRRISDFITKLDSYRQNMTSLSSLDTTSVNDTDSNKNKGSEERHVRFGKQTVHIIYPPAACTQEELWYSIPVLEQKLKDDLTEIRRAKHQQMFSNGQLVMKNKSGATARAAGNKRRLKRNSNNALVLEVNEISTRGLEKYVENTSAYHRRVSQIFVRSVVEQYQREHPPQNDRTVPTADRPAGNQTKPRRSKHRRQQHCSVQEVPRPQALSFSSTHDDDQAAAFRMACEDEVEARRIYLEDGIVLDSTVFAAKRRSSLRAKAKMAAAVADNRYPNHINNNNDDDVRRSYVAKSA